ncbi:MAG: hypothetical protein HC840_29070 [Leptolyngbyaceae cyanobacterium RM2_2_4]|nr:hypothetical protein [Leptolyngbyaceae cyanobacterium SM1_4_3]NJO52779.1 hypothetical protein [Leptolyngbyaceae cyanobacterium RM2_2_4]
MEVCLFYFTRSPLFPNSIKGRSPSSLSHYKLSELSLKEILERSPLVSKSVGEGRSPH